jgi:hypothetical protein
MIILNEQSILDECLVPIPPEGIKYDNNKIQMEFSPMREFQEVARVLTYGAS